ncbi:MAG: cupin domain-containing protein [Rhodobacterales bacterium]|nr:cupin domain-containing protein [Rhodobacterales bacterium]
MTSPILAEARLSTTDLRADLAFFGQVLGMRLDQIHPADNPAVAVLSGHGLRVRLMAGLPETPGTLCLRTDDPAFAGGKQHLVAPGGTRIEVAALNPPVVVPPTAHAFVVRRLADGAPWVIGRAGMHYRDLVPSRLGGAMIASHIRIPDGGPVPDMVHFHKVGFQLIFCLRGWVDVVYEDQGGPLRLSPGDCFIQPPEIRHRVLQASDGIEVIEIGVPADHVTEIDHAMTLPTPHLRPDRRWQGQRFVHNRAEGAPWMPHRLSGYIARDTTIAANTDNTATVRVVRKGQGLPGMTAHDADIMFGFVMSGAVRLLGEGQPDMPLTPGDAFVIPPGMATCLAAPSDDLELLEVALPGDFTTTPC